MLSSKIEKSGKQALKPLDTLEWNGYSVRLFYEGKQLCVELGSAALGQLARWTFCSQRRHTWDYAAPDFNIHVVYRPAQVEVKFRERANGGRLRRLFQLQPPLKEMWTSYQLTDSGEVLISRPDREFSVC